MVKSMAENWRASKTTKRTLVDLIEELGLDIEKIVEGAVYHIHLESIGNAICAYRLENKLTMKKLAEILGVSPAKVSKMESGEYDYTVSDLYNLAIKLGGSFESNFHLFQKT